MKLEQLLIRLASQGLLPMPHNLVIWQFADGNGWGAALETGFDGCVADAQGSTIEEALSSLLRKCGRGADIETGPQP